MVDNDAAALFVSEDGEIKCEPDWIESGKPESGWWLPHLEAAVAAGILRLIRERDEARELAERYGGLNELWPWEVKP